MQNIKYQSIVEAMAHHAISQPDKVFLIDCNRCITYSEMWKRVCILSKHLKSLGIEKGDRVAVKAIQDSSFLISIYAIHLSGGVFVPLEKNILSDRMIEVINTLEAKYLISDYKPDIAIEYIDFNRINEIIDEVVIETEQMAFPQIEDIADILFTTGTTGKSKGIEITHRANIAIAENVIDSVKLEKDDVELIPVPINHSLGLRRYYGATLNGSTYVIADGVLYVNELFEMIDKYQITAITLVPAMLSILLALSKDNLKHYAEQLRFIQLGSAPLLDKEREALCSLLPNTRLYNTYGSTESGCTCAIDFNKYKEKKFCIGKPTINTTIFFVNDEKKIIEATQDQMGYLAFKGDMNMKAYWKEPEITEQVLKDGIIYTNDVGYRGEDGYIYLLGRKGDVINMGGNKIAPSEIEEVTLRYTKVQECVCVPMEDELVGQVPKLYVVMKKNEIFNLKDIYEFLKGKLEFFKVPKVIQEITEIPRTYNGKIQRNKLV